MERLSIKPIAAVAAFGALLAGCATTLEMGPGYYRYDTHASGAPAPRVMYTEPVTVYREPVVVYRDPAVVYPTTTRTTYLYTDHGQ
jgi:hypothetical protein